jgi:UPF0755 protein
VRDVRRALVLGAVLLAGGLGFLFSLLSPVQSRDPAVVSFVVLPGENLEDIASNLHTVGLIREPRAFKFLVRLRREARNLQAGPYRAETSEWAWEIIDRLVEGDVEDTSVTVPEGLWVVEVADVVAPFVEGGADSFRVTALDSVLLVSLGVPSGKPEGYLFPDTYRLIEPTPPEALVRQMVRTFFQIWRRELAERAEEVEMAIGDVVTLASIVEAEARVADERPRIAAVYLNRLRQGLPLQADPTVHYALGKRLRRTLYEDLEVASPYNTYRQTGLPPGPIGNPGLEALKAVLWPLEGCEDLYFVASKDGTHLFAPSFEGHLRNRRLVRQQRNQSP